MNKADKQNRKEYGAKRRGFLKKALYHAPSLYVLGQLSRPACVHADGTGGPDGPPGGGSPFLTSTTVGSSRRQPPKKRKTLRF